MRETVKLAPTKHMPDGNGLFVTPQLKGTVLSFDDYSGQEFDLAKFQTDEPRTVRFSVSRDGKVSVDAEEDYWLIAEVEIPPRQYLSTPALDEKGEQVLDEFGEPQLSVSVAPITATDLKVVLWKLPS